MQRAHRASYQIFRAPIPAGLVVRHQCDIPLCVNPAHLEIGTQAKNIEEREARGRRGIPSADLTDDVKTAIVDLCGKGMTQQQAADLFDLSRSAIEKVFRDRARSKQTHD
ncbi:HNH endonuclease signature motif containing protein [Acidocella sp.]|uniref:HNH endonuclease signature motif containing protein n=1 Tax=Acidocella sp. TaxID=50710 RepID=UPI0038D1E66A